MQTFNHLLDCIDPGCPKKLSHYKHLAKTRGLTNDEWLQLRKVLSDNGMIQTWSLDHFAKM